MVLWSFDDEAAELEILNSYAQEQQQIIVVECKKQKRVCAIQEVENSVNPKRRDSESSNQLKYIANAIWMVFYES